MAVNAEEDSPPRWQIVVAFASVYLIWGSTYLAIRFAVETMPPFLMASARFLSSGVILLLLARARRAALPSRRQLASTAVVGAFLLLGGNGGVSWAEQTVPSSLAALIVATVPLWMVLLEWLWRKGRRPAAQVFLGLALGTAGLIFLIGPGNLVGAEGADPVGIAVLLLAALSWAIGSIYARHAPMPASPLMATAWEMLSGGLFLLLLGLLVGDAAALDVAAISTRSLVSFVYLIVFGAVVGFTAYIWLLRHSTPARAATYAYVNPVIAVFLGWALGDESLNLNTFIAAGLIIAAVIIITVQRTAAPAPQV